MRTQLPFPHFFGMHLSYYPFFLEKHRNWLLLQIGAAGAHGAERKRFIPLSPVAVRIKVQPSCISKFVAI